MSNPTRLRFPQWTSVDLVDNPADEFARIHIWKRDVEKRSFSSDQRKKLAKDGKALPDGSFPIVNKADLKNAVQAFGRAKDKDKAKSHIIKRARALGATEILPESWSVNKKEGTMPELTEEVMKSLPEEVQEYITDLNEELEESRQGSSGEEDEGEEEVAKRDDLPKEVLAYIEKREDEIDNLKTRLDETEEVAKQERYNREIREWQDRFGELKSLRFEDRDKVVKSFRDLAEKDSELAEEQFSVLKAASEQANEGSLFGEIGIDGEVDNNSAEHQMEKIVKGLTEGDDAVDEPEAWSIAMDRNPELYQRYKTETGV